MRPGSRKVKGHYILVDHRPVECTDLLEWADWFEAAERHVRFTRLFDMIEVSTVFLGMDHGLQSHLYLNPYRRPPVLFETMAFWMGDSGEMDRCASWKSAELMHEEMIAQVSRPRAVWSFLWRTVHDTWDEMNRDWQRHWRELRGVQPSELELMMDRAKEKWGW